jgi:hypothetical protein
MAAGGWARTILISRGWGRIRVLAAAPVSLAQYAIPATKILRRACHPALMTTTMLRVTERGWSRKFDDPIPLPMGYRLITLEDAGTYITKLRGPTSLQRTPRSRNAPSRKEAQCFGRSSAGAQKNKTTALAGLDHQNRKTSISKPTANAQRPNVQAETTRTRLRRSCGFSWDRSVIATAPHS